jgi:hypothetical protein
LLNGLAEADRRATQRGKHKNYESRIKTESHEYFLSFVPTSIEIPEALQGNSVPAHCQKAKCRLQNTRTEASEADT